jgi:exosortase/archaeosortase family protein
VSSKPFWLHPNTRTGFTVRFAAVLTLLGLAQLVWFNAELTVGQAWADILASALRAFGWQARALPDSSVAFPGGLLIIGPECTGLDVMGLFASFCVAYPSSLTAKTVGISLGISALFIANFLRLFGCAWLLSVRPEWFTFLHDYVWQVLLVAVALGFAATWARHVDHVSSRSRT